MTSGCEHGDGQFFFVQWEGLSAFVHGSWRTSIAAVNEAFHSFLHCSPSRLIVLKVVQASVEDEKRLTNHFRAIAPGKWSSAPNWRENNAALQGFIRELPCSTRQARAAIGLCEGRLLWRPNDEARSMAAAKEVIIELLGQSRLPCSPSTLHALPGTAIPLQTIYNTLGKLAKAGLVSRPEPGLYVLTKQGQALYSKLIQAKPPRKSIQSLCI